MFFDHALAKTRLTDWGRQLEGTSLPSWEELPDLPLYMDQVILLLEQYLPRDPEAERGVTASIVNNYVRMKVMPAPVKKKYTRIHLAYLIMICVLKQSLSIACIQKLLPLDATPEQISLLYADFAARYREMALYFAGQLQEGAAPLFRSEDGSPNPVGTLAVGAALMANYARDLADQLVLLQKTPEET